MIRLTGAGQGEQRNPGAVASQSDEGTVMKVLPHPHILQKLGAADARGLSVGLLVARACARRAALGYVTAGPGTRKPKVRILLFSSVPSQYHFTS